MPQATPQPLILVIEAEDNVALAIGWLLTRAGYRQGRIASGEGAVEVIGDLRPDLVLLDAGLPGVSGHEVCRAVRADPRLAATRILLMTARGSALEQRRGIGLGADGFVAKPIDPAELRGAIDRLLTGGARPPQANGSAG